MYTYQKEEVLREIDRLERRANAAQAKLAAMVGVPLDAEARAARSDAQAKAKAVYDILGTAEPIPTGNEGVAQYRLRVAGELQKHSNDYCNANLRDVARQSWKAFTIAERQIYADAIKLGSSYAWSPNPNQLRVRKETDETGRQWTTYSGKPSVWMNDFKLPPKLVKGWYDTKSGREISGIAGTTIRR